ncbi:unnamed protein product, partial [Prorocentrum cordatum]
LEPEQLDAVVVVHLVHLRQLLRQIRLGDVGHAGVDNVEDELPRLLPAQQRVLLELAGAHRELRHRSRRRVAGSPEKRARPSDARLCPAALAHARGAHLRRPLRAAAMHERRPSVVRRGGAALPERLEPSAAAG